MNSKCETCGHASHETVCTVMVANEKRTAATGSDRVGQYLDAGKVPCGCTDTDE